MIRLIRSMLPIMKGVSVNTHLWCFSVLAGAILLCVSFFMEPAQRQLDVADEDTQVIAEANVIEYSSVFGDLMSFIGRDDEEGAKDPEIIVDCLKPSDRESELLDTIDEIYSDVSEQNGNIACDDDEEFVPVGEGGVDLTRQYSNETVDLLEKLVQCEASTEDLDGRILVADVVINRVDTGIWGNDLLSVIQSPGQFEPIDNGAYLEAVVDNVTKNAVLSALAGDDLSKGAIYFQKSNAKVWGDKKFLFRHGSHSFYR